MPAWYSVSLPGRYRKEPNNAPRPTAGFGAGPHHCILDRGYVGWEMRTIYKVYWDNGNGACGTFPIEFDTEEAAQEYANDWAHECNVRDDIHPDSESAYSAEVVTEEVPEDTEGEGWDEIGELRQAALNHRGQP